MNSKKQIVIFVIVLCLIICGIGAGGYYYYTNYIDVGTKASLSADMLSKQPTNDSVSDDNEYEDLMGDNPLEKSVLYWLDTHGFKRRYKYYVDGDTVYIKGTNIILQSYEGELYPGDTCFNYIDYNGYNVNFEQIYDAVRYLYYEKEFLYESYSIKEYNKEHIILTNLTTGEDITITWKEVDDVSESFEL